MCNLTASTCTSYRALSLLILHKHVQIEVDAYHDPESSLPSSADGTLFGMMDWGRLHSRRPSKLPGHDDDEGSRAAAFCSEAAKSLLKKLLEDVEVRCSLA